MSLPQSFIGTVSGNIQAQPEYPQASRSESAWELTMKWIVKDTEILNLAPPFKQALVNLSAPIAPHWKTMFSNLICSDVQVSGSTIDGYCFMTAVYVVPENIENNDIEEWTTNSQYKEISLIIDDLDLSPSLSQEEKEAELKKLKEKGVGSKPEGEVQVQYKRNFSGNLSLSNILTTVGQDVNPPGVGSGDGKWRHIGRSITKSKDEKIETDTYQYYNEVQ